MPTGYLPAAALSRGRHADPSDGACLMELASRIAGEPWSDHPACVHPVLAAIARGVNDGVGDVGRARLALLAPAMVGTAPPHDAPPGRLLAGSARLALHCAEMALDHAASDGPEMAWARQLALAVLAREGRGEERGRGDHAYTSGITARFAVAALDRAGLLARAYPVSAARQVTQAVALLRTPASEENDRRLTELLQDCIACVAGPGQAA